MAKIITDDSHYKAIADAIRIKEQGLDPPPVPAIGSEAKLKSNTTIYNTVFKLVVDNLYLDSWAIIGNSEATALFTPDTVVNHIYPYDGKDAPFSTTGFIGAFKGNKVIKVFDALPARPNLNGYNQYFYQMFKESSIIRSPTITLKTITGGSTNKSPIYGMYENCTELRKVGMITCELINGYNSSTVKSPGLSYYTFKGCTNLKVAEDTVPANAIQSGLFLDTTSGHTNLGAGYRNDTQPNVFADTAGTFRGIPNNGHKYYWYLMPGEEEYLDI